jgi:propionyl-CoA carboxylase beta chain
MALQNRAPIIGLFDAGGARIQEGVAALGGYGEVFTAMCRPPASFRRFP